MITGPIIAEIAALVGDPARAAMVSALLDGRALTASELALAARVTPQTASTDLAKLTRAGLLSVVRNGRHRHFRLASSRVDFGCTITATTDRFPHRRDRGDGNQQEVAVLEGQTRIPPLEVETLPDDLRETLEEQRTLRGAPLYPYLFYARNPAYFRAAKAMWAALQQETKRVPAALRALLNRRVAWWNGCEF
jgi:DNA-binding transcriptional ArsR family regulator